MRDLFNLQSKKGIRVNSVPYEKKTVSAMIRIYCKSKHGQRPLCEGCDKLLQYAEKRNNKCKFGEQKPACKDCPVHCYSQEMKEKIRKVMQFSGPRMIYKHPVMAIMHLLK
jgi:hypothetical protein